MKRYIDAHKLIAHLEEEIEACEPQPGDDADIAHGTIFGLEAALAFAKALPAADMVEVVRCKDCDHATIIVNSADGSKHWYCTKGYGLPEVATTDFCSRGERSKG